MAVARELLEQAVAPVPLGDVLASLKLAGWIKGYEIADRVVRLDADLTAVELYLREKLEEHCDKLGDDIERGFSVSSDVDGRRGASTAKAADVDAIRAYYARAQDLLNDTTLSVRARRIWELHTEGLSDERIAAMLGMTRRQLVTQLCILRFKAGITKTLQSYDGGK